MKVKITIAIVFIALLASGGGFYFTQNLGGSNEAVFLPLDEFLVDIFVPQNQGANKFLRIKVTLEIEREKDVESVILQMSKVRDAINFYVRDLRAEDLTGSGGMYYLRQEILLRINKVLFPVVVKNILFNEIVRG